MTPRQLAAVGLAVATVALAGCTPTVHLEPAEHANSPLCAEVTVGLQNAGTVAGEPRRWTDAQATAAWGETSTAVLLRCGLPEPAPTSELRCITIGGIDWLVDPSETPNMRLTTYGRDPAVQLYIDTTAVSSNDIIADRGIIGAVTSVTAHRRCTTPDELDPGVEDQLTNDSAP